MANLDMKKTLKHLYKPSAKQVSVVDIQPLPYLMIDGKGDPNTSEQYQQAIEALYPLAYGIRAICKAEEKVFTVMPLEGLWTIADADKPPEDFIITTQDKSKFIWTMMILQPEFVTSDMVEQARQNIEHKKGCPVRLKDIRFETYHEGNAAQILHIGSYVDEAPTVACLHGYIEEKGWQLRGKHHEIYLSDPRKVAPEKLKTIIRHPFES